ncbi:MAG: DsbA family oxidoreductase [Proteobacteria bacterium]|nr:DsbA family oxidoreductase [Pseudomonadota bacterium]
MTPPDDGARAMEPALTCETPAAGRIDIVSDAICPWCYIGKRQLEHALAMVAADGLRFDIHWNPYQLNPDMPREGVERMAYRIAKFGGPERAAAIDARVTEAAAGVGLGFRTDLMRRTPNTVAAHRVIWLAGREGRQDAVVERLFDAYFVRGQDIGAPEVLAAEAGAAGLGEAAVAAFLAGTEGEQEVLRADAQARQAGVEGVPSFFMDGHFLFSGAMPADTMAAAFRRAHAILANRAA